MPSTPRPRKSAQPRRTSPKFSREAALISRSATATVAPSFGTVAVQLARPKYTYAERNTDNTYLPVQAVVDRRSHDNRTGPLSETIVVIEIRDPQTGELLEELHYPLFGKYGQPHPCDPALFTLHTSFERALCPTLAPYAAARCGLW